MTSTRPYLLRACIDWIVDNDCTPMAQIDCGVEGVAVPDAYIKDGGIVLNLSATATRNLEISNSELVVDCRFGGKAHRVRAPVGAITAVFARENGQGMAFGTEPPATPQASSPETPASKPDAPRKGPHLSLVKPDPGD